MAYLVGGLLALGILRFSGRDHAYKTLLGLLACHVVFHWLATDQIQSRGMLFSEMVVREGTAAARVSDFFGKATLLSCIFFSMLQGREGMEHLVRQWGVRVALFYFGTCSMLALVSVTPGFLWSEAWLVAFLLVFAGSRLPIDTRLRAVVWYYAALVFVSLVAIPLVFSKVMDPHAGYLPFRFRGVLDHANAMGMTCGAGLVLSLYLKGFQLAQRVGLAALFLLALVLAQSKAVLIFVFFLLMIRFGPALFKWIHEVVPSWTPRRLAMFGGGAILAALPFVNPARLLSAVATLLGTTEAATLSLTGRQAIWAITLQTWARHPLVGYGPGLWGVEFRDRMGMSFAGQAHNQYLHTLGEFGLLGAMVLGIYLFLLGRRAWKLRTHLPAGIPLLALLLVVGMVEAPLRDPIYRAGFLLHMGLLTVLSEVTQALGASTEEYK